MARENHLKKIATGGVLFGAGRLSSSFFQLIIGILVVRLVKTSEYGLISLGLTCIAMATSLCVMGFGLGLPRMIAACNSEGSNKGQAGGLITSSLVVTIIFSLCFAVFLFFRADLISGLLHKPDLSYVLKLLSFMLPPMVLSANIASAYQGFEDPRPQVFFNDMTFNLTKVVLLTGVALAGLGYVGVLSATVAAAWLTASLLAIYANRNISWHQARFHGRTLWGLVLFSLPLLGVQLLGQLMGWTAILTLGFYHPSDVVAFYAAPLRLTVLLTLPLTAVAYLYLPIATRIVEGGEEEGLAELYTSATKWSFLMTFPVSFFFLMDSELVVTTIFGANYLPSAPILATLTLGYTFHSILGPNGMTLIAFGKRKAILFATIVGALSTVAVTLLLVPNFGPLGASVGTASGLVVLNASASFALNTGFRIHPFRRDYMKPAVATIAVALLIWVVGDILQAGRVVRVGILLFIALGSILSPVITNSLTVSELEVLQRIEMYLFNRSLLTEKLAKWKQSCT